MCAFNGCDHRVCHAEQSHSLPHRICQRLIASIEHSNVLALRAAPIRDENVDYRSASTHHIVLGKSVGSLNITARSWLDDGNISAVVGQDARYGNFWLENSELCRCGANAEILDQARINPDARFRSFSRALGNQHHVHEGRFARLVKALSGHHRIVPVKHLFAFCRIGTGDPTLALTAYKRERISRAEADKRDACHDCIGSLRRARAVDCIAHGCCSP